MKISKKKTKLNVRQPIPLTAWQRKELTFVYKIWHYSGGSLLSRVMFSSMYYSIYHVICTSLTFVRVTHSHMLPHMLICVLTTLVTKTRVSLHRHRHWTLQ